jgi:hypothetical protein
MDHRVFHYLTKKKPARATTPFRTKTNKWDGGNNTRQVKMSITSVPETTAFSDKDNVVE